MPQQDEVAVKEQARRGLTTFTDQLVEPLTRLRSEVDRLFDDFPARWPGFQLGRLTPAALPAAEMTETDKAYKLSFELPGMEADDIEVSVTGDLLIVAGEKKEEREEQEKDYRYTERSYGAFERRIQLPPDADVAKIDARVRKGVLKVTLPKDGKVKDKRRRIAVKAA
jgi:HSP20 family protein